jgi:hypothetical protein
MASELEKIPDRAMFQILKQVARNCESEGISFGSINVEVSEVINDTLKIFGVVDKIRYIDDDYIWMLVNLNKDKLSDDKLTGSLIRPQLKEYEFDTQVSETVYQTQSWENTIESYGDPYYLARLMEYQGDFEYYEGKQGYSDVHDSEINEITIVRKSFTEI